MYFGTDGIRGEYGKTLTCDLAFSVGNALSQIKTNPRVVIGHDTRCSADALMLSVAAGVVQGGGSVTSVGIIPTAGISYLTESEKFDFGVIITASHNPANYNGIKIFDHTGRKLGDSVENFLEEFFKNNYIADSCGNFVEILALHKKYAGHLRSSVGCRLDGMTICLDASNGAAYKMAPMVFQSLGAKVVKLSCKHNGRKINDRCGCLFVENLASKVVKLKADIGFAYDGYSDRVIAVDGNGKVFDGDKLLYILATQMRNRELLFANTVVGTSHTNSGIMVGPNRHKINLIRTDIGDKYVIEAMEKMNLTLGGEQSGHIIIKSHAQTGDGILTSLKICEIIKNTGKSLEELFDAQLVPQCNLSLSVKDKIKVMNNEELCKLITKISNEIAPAGRVMLRASGTEDKVRIMVEHPNKDEAEKFVEQIKILIEKV